ncbi:MAG: DUF1015 domain-containing protein [archaeon]|nr:DUF1015 domain-containing protein [archaeon]
MVTFLPFKGLRPALAIGETITSRVSPPYDVIDDELLKKLQVDPHNVTHLTMSPDKDKRYTDSKKLMEEMIADKYLKQDTPSFYFYEQNFVDNGKNCCRRGIVGILKTEEYSEGHIIPHEQTFAKVKSDRLNLLRDAETHFESIMGIYPGLGAELSRKVEAEARLIYRVEEENGVEHRFYRIYDEATCAAITEKLKDQNVLIADGHHRYETALEYAKENPDCEAKQYVLCTLISSEDSGLIVRPTHRYIDAEDIGETSAVKKISKKMKVQEVTLEDMEAQLKDHLFGMVFRSGKCLLLDNPDGIDNAMMAIDTYSAQENVLYGVYKSDEGKSKITYDADYESVKKTIAEKKHDAAIILNAPKLETIWELAGKGKKMPKKTTFFYPKIWSGFVFYRMDQE